MYTEPKTIMTLGTLLMVLILLVLVVWATVDPAGYAATSATPTPVVVQYAH